MVAWVWCLLFIPQAVVLFQAYGWDTHRADFTCMWERMNHMGERRVKPWHCSAQWDNDRVIAHRVRWIDVQNVPVRFIWKSLSNHFKTEMHFFFFIPFYFILLLLIRGGTGRRGIGEWYATKTPFTHAINMRSVSGYVIRKTNEQISLCVVTRYLGRVLVVLVEIVSLSSRAKPACE